MFAFTSVCSIGILLYTGVNYPFVLLSLLGTYLSIQFDINLFSFYNLISQSYIVFVIDLQCSICHCICLLEEFHQSLLSFRSQYHSNCLHIYLSVYLSVVDLHLSVFSLSFKCLFFFSLSSTGESSLARYAELPSDIFPLSTYRFIRSSVFSLFFSLSQCSLFSLHLSSSGMTGILCLNMSSH